MAKSVDGSQGPAEAPTQKLPASPNGLQAVQDADEDARVCPRCGTEAAATAYCANCGLHLAAASELPTRAAWQARWSSDPPTAAAAPALVSPSEKKQGGRSLINVLVPIIALIAIAGLVVAVVGLVMNRPKSDASLRSQVHRLQSQLSAADQQLASAQTAVSTMRAGSQAGAVSSLQSQMHRLTTCIPQVMAYVNGLNINGSYVTDASGNQLMTNPLSVSSGVQISRDCSSLLYGNGP